MTKRQKKTRGDPADPWAGLRAAVRTGRLRPMPEPGAADAMARRPFDPAEEDREPTLMTWEAMAAAGNRDAAEVEFHRRITEDDESDRAR